MAECQLAVIIMIQLSRACHDEAMNFCFIMIIFIDFDMGMIFVRYELIQTQFIIYAHFCHIITPPKHS